MLVGRVEKNNLAGNCDIAAVGEQQQIGADVPGQQTSAPQRKLTTTLTSIFYPSFSASA
jgi:hypothetical protein